MQLLTLHQLFLRLHGLVQELLRLRLTVQAISQTVEGHALGLLNTLGCIRGVRGLPGGVHRVLKHGVLLLVLLLLLDQKAWREYGACRSLYLERFLVLRDGSAAEAGEGLDESATVYMLLGSS